MTPEQRDAYKVDRTGWAPGPWDGEPEDRVDWEHAGLPCFALRHLDFGNWAGYVGVPPGHPLYGAAAEDSGLAVCYSAACSPPICHVPKPGTSDEVWWFGFDCAHAWDITPGSDAFLRFIAGSMPEQDRQAILRVISDDDRFIRRTYKTIDYVRERVNAMAEQLAQCAKEGANA